MSEIAINVRSLLSAGEPQGQFCLSVSPESTVENLLKQLCTDSGVSLKPDYVLQTKNQDVLDRRATLSEAGLEDGVILHWTRESHDSFVHTKTAGRSRTAGLIALVSFIIGAVGIVTICIVKFKDATFRQDFAVVFDAGSTHTSMFIYVWDPSKFHGTAVATQFGKKCAAGDTGITGFENEPQNAGDSLQTCLDVARAAIPASQHSRTPVYLGATAGMRLLRLSNSSASEAILDSVRSKFSESAFLFDKPATSARILSGSEEGAFSWITSNYVANAFRVNRPDIADIQAYTIVPSIGAMDLGGASTQITFVPEEGTVMPANHSRELQLFGHSYTVYTHSYLCYGVQEMSRRMFAYLILDHPGHTSVEHPCLPTGFNLTQTRQQIFESPCVPAGPSVLIINYTFVGSSNNKECEMVVRRALFNFSSCSYSRCSFNGVYQPPVTGPFYAFSSFYYVSNFLNLSDSNSSSFQHKDFEQAIGGLCNSSWAKMMVNYMAWFWPVHIRPTVAGSFKRHVVPVALLYKLQQIPVSSKENESLVFYCLQSHYINLLLSEGYNFNDTFWNSILFVSRVSGSDIGWTLGFVLNESSDYPSSHESLGSLTFAWLLALFTGLFILAIVVCIDARRAGLAFGSRHRQAVSQYGAI